MADCWFVACNGGRADREAETGAAVAGGRRRAVGDTRESLSGDNER